MMLYPSVDELTKNSQSRYSLVIAVSKRARKILDDSKQEGVMLKEKPVRMAINEIAAGKVVYREKV